MLPLNPKPEIEMDRLKRVFIKENVLSDNVCNEIIEFGRTSVVTGVNKYPTLFQIRFKSCLLPIDHYVHSLLQEVWVEASNHIGTEVEFVEPYELKQYLIGDFFGRHVDNYYSLSKNIDRKITMSIQLSDYDEYEGGDLIILNQKIPRKKGSVIAFPSLLSHEVKTVIKGERWSLISWAWGPEWK